MVNRTKIDITKSQKTSAFFFNLGWKGGVVGFCLVLILLVVGEFCPEIKEAKILIPCFSFLMIYFFVNMSITAAINCLLELILVRRKKLTKRMGLEQAFVYLVLALSFWLGVYWIVRELINYLKIG